MYFKKFLPVVLALVLVGQTGFVFARNGDDAEEKAAEIRKNTLELLRETAALTAMLNSPGNRINFTVSIADSLWNLDKTEAASMFNIAIEDVRKMISQTDAEMNFAAVDNTSTNRRRTSTKISQALSWRSIVVNSLANRDAEWALRFLSETEQSVTNPDFKKQIDRSSKSLKTNIARKIAEQDVTKALELGREKLSQGITGDAVNLLQKIYTKDTEKGIEFGKDILKKTESVESKRDSSWIYMRLFQYGLSAMTNTDKPPVFDNSAMKKLAEKLAKEVTKPTSRYRGFSPEVMAGLEKYSPQSVAQVKTAFEQRTSRRSNNRSRQSTRISNEMRAEINTRKDAVKMQNEINNSFKNLTSENISSDEKLKILSDLQNKIMLEGVDNLRFINLVRLSDTANSIGETKRTEQILSEAERLVNQDPKTKTEFADSRSLASSYARVDADKSFQILENIAYRLNGVIDGYIKFMEYSNDQRTVENGELVMGNHSKQFTNYFSLPSKSLYALAEKDFNRVRDLADKFERPEVRIAVRLMIVRGLLNSNQSSDLLIQANPSSTARILY